VTRALFLIAAATALLPGTALAGDSTGAGDLRRENAELRDRVQRLEEQLAEVLRRLDAVPAAGAPRTDLDAQTDRLLESLAREYGPAAEKGLKPVLSTVDVELYGFVKVDAAHDTARTSTGNLARWVESEEDAGNDDDGNVTARDTRLGLRLRGPPAAGAKTSAQVELDFYGDGAENKPQPMLRHAFFTIDWADLGLSLLAGQTWDVISPQLPFTLNSAVLWWAGNIGYRRPQVRLTGKFAVAESTTFECALAATRSIGRSSAFGALDSGQDAGTPGGQGRAAITRPLIDGRPATLGVSGHVAKEQYDTAKDGSNEDIGSWSVCLDFALPVADWLTLKGECHRGENLDQYVGGIGQGVNLTSLTGIAAAGGWVAAAIGPFTGWTFGLGASRERVARGDVDLGARARNRAIFVHAVYALDARTSVGLELFSWRTTYAGKAAGDSLRIQMSFIFKF
jgi:hypothetical protein